MQFLLLWGRNGFQPEFHIVQTFHQKCFGYIIEIKKYIKRVTIDVQLFSSSFEKGTWGGEKT
jgi:hypothetical protein